MKTTILLRRAREILLTAAVLILASAASLEAQGYRTDAVVTPNNNECRGIPECVSSVMPAVAVPARSHASSRFACPPSHPFIWAWDVGLHEHVAVTLITGDPTSVTIEGANRADVAGHFVVILGCSIRPHDGASVLTSRQAAPTGWLPGMRRPHAIYPAP